MKTEQAEIIQVSEPREADRAVRQRSGALEVRTPTENDLPEILAVIDRCGPYLTAHGSYIAWMAIHNFSDTCAVAELDGEIVGWRSAMPVSGTKAFVHQVGVAPKARRHGVAKALLLDLVNKLKTKSEVFELEFTIDSTNQSSLATVTTVARKMGMRLLKTGQVINLERECFEEVYRMTAGGGSIH